MKITAVYLRVSSESQKEASQLPDVEAWEARNADKNVVRYPVDKFTGKTKKRPGWMQLEADIDAGKIGTLVVWRTDRLGRTMAGLAALYEKLIALGVNFISLTEGFDLNTPAGRLTAHVVGAAAEYELEVKGERQRAGIGVAKSKGVYKGGKKGRRVACTAEKEAAVIALRNSGMRPRIIARQTGLSKDTVYRVLRAKGLAQPTTAV